MLNTFLKLMLGLFILSVLNSGCGKSAYYPGYVSPCVEAKQVRKEAQQAQGDEKAMLEVKAQGLEEACRNSMNNREEKSKNKLNPPVF